MSENSTQADTAVTIIMTCSTFTQFTSQNHKTRDNKRSLALLAKQSEVDRHKVQSELQLNLYQLKQNTLGTITQ
jgi:hypothetical protein